MAAELAELDTNGYRPAGTPTILATSMGFDRTGRNPTDWRPGPVFTEAFRLAGEPDRPRLCFLATAGATRSPASPASTARSPAPTCAPPT